VSTDASVPCIARLSAGLPVSEVNMLARVMVSAMVALALGQGVFAGCTCSMPAGGCGRGWNSGHVIFLGKVTADIETEGRSTEGPDAESAKVFLQGSGKTPLMNHEVHFTIAESFRGEGQPGQEIVVHSRMSELRMNQNPL